MSGFFESSQDENTLVLQAAFLASQTHFIGDFIGELTLKDLTERDWDHLNTQLFALDEFQQQHVKAVDAHARDLVAAGNSSSPTVVDDFMAYLADCAPDELSMAAFVAVKDAATSFQAEVSA